jgi:dTDP-glucose 4,6-dehydratase
MSTLVVGSLGVIGTHLTRHLRQNGHDVIGTDVLIRDYDDYVRADITSFEELYRVFRKHEIETVVHMAGEVGRLRGEEYPQKMIYVNDVGTLNIINLCLDFGCKLVFFSTSEVYGRMFDSSQPMNEQDLDKASVFGTTNIYAMSKLFGEAIIRHYVENYGLRAVTVRPFMIYGPGEYPSKYRSAISNFVHKALMCDRITVHRGTVRAWCYISDFIDGLALVMKMPTGGKYEAYNIGSDEYHTMEEVALTIVKETNADSRQIEIVDPPDRFLSAVKRASIDKVKSIGYHPRVTLREGIRNVIKWQKEVMGSTEY